MALRQAAMVTFSGVLMWAAFPDVGWWPLLFLSLASLTGVVGGARPTRGAWLAALWALVFFLPHTAWMNVATNGTYVAWILLALAQAFFLAIWGAMFAATHVWKFARTWWGEALVAGVLWVGIEQLRARVPFGGFPWAKVPYALVDAPLVSLAPLGGELLVSFVAVFLAVLIRQGVIRGISGPRRGWLLAGALALLFLPGLIKLPVGAQNGTVSILVVQGNVEIPMESTYAVEGKVTGNHLEETARALSGEETADLVLWGEDSVDRDPNRSAVTGQQVEQVLALTGSPLVAGYQEYGPGERYNWVGTWYPDSGQGESKYGKQHPVPWGEYVPFRQVSEFLATEAATVSVDMVPVDNPAIIDVTLADGRTIPIAVGICFEAGDEPIFAEGVQLGGEMILVPTNNSHFRSTPESTQQLQMVQFRAAEFSRAAIQVSTNGVSAVIAPNGKVIEQTERQVADHIFAEVPLRTVLTPAATVVGAIVYEWMALTLLGGGAAIVVYASRRIRRGQSG